MAGSTNNYHFIKPADDEAADNTPLNTNFDNIDAALGAHDDALAIVSDGNTHAAIAAGQFVYVRNHGTLANGLYTANSNIAANATLSSSNLTADSSGGLNALKAEMENVTENIGHVKKNSIASGASASVSITRPCLVSVGRSSSSTTTTAFIDGWSGITYISNNPYFTISASNETLTITNSTGGYANYIVVY